MPHRFFAALVAVIAVLVLVAGAPADDAKEMKVKGKIDKIDSSDGTVLILKVDDKNAERRFKIGKMTNVLNEKGERIAAKELKEADKVEVTYEVTEKEGKKTRHTKEVRVTASKP
jgi:hypothetical protein